MSAIVPDPEDIGKIFVGGLSSATTKESLSAYFNQFGEVVDSVVMKNNETGRSRGFGFITFKDPTSISKVLRVNYHELDGKKIDPKECTPRSMQKIRKQAGKCKVFLGGLPPNVTEEEIRSGMSRFGKVDQVVIIYDQETKKCRGFGFISFELPESIEQACAEHYVIISGKQVECKRAEPLMKPKSLTNFYGLQNSQNGFVKQPQLGHLMPVQQSNWNSPTSQNLFSYGSAPYPSYVTYTSTPLASPSDNIVSPGYTPVQPYVQPYPINYGTPVANYYSAVATNTYPQPDLTRSSMSASVSAQNIPVNEAEKSHGLKDYVQKDYVQTQSTYGPLKVIGENASDVIYSTQNMLHAPNHQRFHPYKMAK